MATPSNPAPVGLPGALSVRTDGGPSDTQPIRSLPDPAYGEGQEFRALQQAAPLPLVPEQGVSPVGLFDPTARPDEPVTAGIASGPGDGPESVGSPMDVARTDAKTLAAYLPDLIEMTKDPDAPQGFIKFVRRVQILSGARRGG